MAAGALKSKGHWVDFSAKRMRKNFYALSVDKHLKIPSICCSDAQLRVVWRESNWAVRLDSLPLTNASSLIDTILNADRILNIQKGDLNAFALNATIIMDILWMAWNKMVHNSTLVVTRQLVLYSHKRYAEHVKAWEVHDLATGLRWKPPPLGCLKMNSDVAIRPNGSYITISIRDSTSSFCMAYTERLVAMDPLVG